jgi:hypothetical protein
MTHTPPPPPPADAERDSGLDETLRESFPASDPPSTIPDPEPAAPAETPGKPAPTCTPDGDGHS